MRTWPTMVVWVLTRALVVYWLLGPEPGARGDLFYYQHSLDALADHGVRGTLAEYPVPAFVLLAIPYLILQVAHLTVAYPTVIVAAALLTDLFFLRFLMGSRRWRRDQPAWLHVTAAEWTWLLVGPALGATTYARFDLIPGVLVGMALLYAVQRPGLAAGFGAMATGVKYWPAIVLPTLAAPAGTRRKTITAGAAAGMVIGVISLVIGGWYRIVSPLQYQGTRGLQIESVFASPAMARWVSNPHDYTVYYASSKAYEVTGPSVALLLHLSSIATLVFALVLAGLWGWSWLVLKDPEQSIDVLVWLVLASVTGFIVTSKVFSPQYLLWVLPGAAAGLVVLRGHRCWNHLAGWTMVLLAATLMTHEIFPRNYDALTAHAADSSAIVSLLVTRNAIITGLCLVAAGEAVWLLWRMRPAKVAEPVEEHATVDA